MLTKHQNRILKVNIKFVLQLDSCDLLPQLQQPALASFPKARAALEGTTDLVMGSGLWLILWAQVPSGSHLEAHP